MENLPTRLRTEQPVWCDECRVRIAPYEVAVVIGNRALHVRCSRRLEGMSVESIGAINGDAPVERNLLN
jgi:hypothetical protein